MGCSNLARPGKPATTDKPLSTNLKENDIVQNCQRRQPAAPLRSTTKEDRAAASWLRLERHRPDLARAPMAGRASRPGVPCPARAAALRAEWRRLAGELRQAGGR